MAAPDPRSFHLINGQPFVRVTAALSILDKPGLAPWYAKQAQAQYEAALLETLSGLDLVTLSGQGVADAVLDGIAKALPGVKAAQAETAKAASIGLAAHAWIEWETRRRCGEKVGPEPKLPDAAAWAVEAWKDWAKAVDFAPIVAERIIWCEDPRCRYAGTMDVYARVRGAVTVVDYKTGKAIYPEAFLQNIAYRHAAARANLPSEGGLIVRLPKVMTDPAFEAVPVPDDVTIEDFLAVLHCWRWMRRMDGKPA